MHARKRGRLRISSFNLDTVVNLTRPHGTVQDYINEVIKFADLSDKYQFITAVNNFKTFIRLEFERNEFFDVDHILKGISYQTLKRNTLHFLILNAAVVESDLANRMLIANKISGNMEELELDPDPRVYPLLERILTFLTRTVKTSSQLVFQPFFQKVTKAITGLYDENAVIASFRFVILVLRKFSNMFKDDSRLVNQIINFGILHENEVICDLCRDVIKAALRCPNHTNLEHNFHSVIDLLVAEITKMDRIETRTGVIKAAVRASNTIIECKPDWTSRFKLQQVPMNLLKSDQNELIQLAFLLFPFVAATQTSLFQKEDLHEVNSVLEKLSGANSPLRDQALIALGDFIFGFLAVHGRAEDLDGFGAWMFSQPLDSDAACYAFVAAAALSTDQFKEKFRSVFVRQISKLLIKAMCATCRLFPRWKLLIHSMVVEAAGPILMDSESTTEAVENALEAMNILEIGKEAIDVSLALRLSVHLYSSNVAICQAVLELLLRYENQNPAVELFHELLSFAATEMDDSVRLDVITNLKPIKYDALACMSLESLIHDDNIRVQIHSFKLLCRELDIEEAEEIVVTFLEEKLNEFKEKKSFKTVDVFFLILGNIALKESLTSPASIIFSRYSETLIQALSADDAQLRTKSIQLLEIILNMNPSQIDYEWLAVKINQSLAIHASVNHLNAGLSLLNTAFDRTPLVATIYSKHKFIIGSLKTLVSSNPEDVSEELLLRVVSKIGAVDVELMTSIYKELSKKKGNDARGVQYFLAQSTGSTKEQHIQYAALDATVANLFAILENAGLSSLHPITLDTLLRISKNNHLRGVKTEKYLLETIQKLLEISPDSGENLLMSNISIFLMILGDHFCVLIPTVIELVFEKWNIMDKEMLVSNIEKMTVLRPLDMAPYIPKLAALFITGFRTGDPNVVNAICSAFIAFGAELSNVDILIIPELLNWLTWNAYNTKYCMEGLSRLKTILGYAGARKFSAQIVVTMSYLIKTNDQLHGKIIEVLTIVAIKTGTEFLLHVPAIRKVMDIPENSNLMRVIGVFETNGELPPDLSVGRRQRGPESNIKKKPSQMIISSSLAEAQIDIEIPDHMTAMKQWCDELYMEAISKSPIRMICSVSDLAGKYWMTRELIGPLAVVLLLVDPNAPTVLLESFKEIFTNNIPVTKMVMRQLLSIFEMIEVVGAEFPCGITKKMLKEKALEVDMLELALRYAEDEFEENIDQLIMLNTKLGCSLSAKGVLKKAQMSGVKIQQTALSEQLGLWDEALAEYKQQLDSDPDNKVLIEGKLRCLRALSLYEELESCAGSDWPEFKASSLWYQLKFDEFGDFVLQLPETQQTLFYRILAHVSTSNFEKAQESIDEFYRTNRTNLFPLIADSYKRAFPEFSKISLISEIEDVIMYKKNYQDSLSCDPWLRGQAKERIDHILLKWKSCFDRLPDDPHILLDHIAIHTLVLSKSQLRDEWIRLLNVAIVKKRTDMVSSVIQFLTSDGSSTIGKCETEYHASRLLWEFDHRDDAIKKLDAATKLDISDNILGGVMQTCLANWLYAEDNYTGAIEHAKKAIDLNPESRTAWKCWSAVNLALFDSTNESRYLEAAFDGSLSGLLLSIDNALPFTLRILSVLFRRGNMKIYEAFQQKMEQLPIHIWIAVLPQIVARTNSKDPMLRAILQDTIYRVGVKHPQAVIYALMVPVQNIASERHEIAVSILEKLQILYPDTVSDITVLVSELVRVSSTWYEIWKFSIDEASRKFVSGDYDGCVDALAPAYRVFERDPETFIEVSFMRAHGKHFLEAKKEIEQYQATKNRIYLDSAWSKIVQPFIELRNICAGIQSLDLRDASPKLASMKNSKIIVPGTYEVNKELVTIEKFEKEVPIIDSKQSPRRMRVIGSDGVVYTHLLKAHEDTRLDQRVMQLFSLVNTLVNNSSIEMARQLTLTTYKVIPLTREVGLIGWVQRCQTIFSLASEVRDRRKMVVDTEYQAVLKHDPDFDKKTTVEERLPGFLEGLKACPADELKTSLLSKARDSPHWLERRQNYTASLAMTSMIGYILGLGDRHMQNIMMKMRSGKLVHIDFGDCFEIAMKRSHTPETVQFRLTRNLVNALEVSGIEGTFRSCCEHAMDLMRANSDQIVGLLEVFVYDPLRQWIDAQNPNEATQIISTIEDKLKGHVYGQQHMPVVDHVDKLIEEATDPNNLCRMFRGWYPWL